MKKNTKHGIMLAIVAAALYAINSPFSKILLNYMPSTLMAGFLYVGAVLGMGLIALIKKVSAKSGIEAKLTKTDPPFSITMILLDIAAPICLLLGLSMTTAANASLLNKIGAWLSSQ